MLKFPQAPAKAGNPLPDRILVTGKNSELPSFRVLLGVAPDGAVLTARSATPVCPHCMGRGEVWMEASYSGLTPAGYDECEACHGTGEPASDEECEA